MDGWRLHPAASSSARGGQHRPNPTDCWGSVLESVERATGCGGGEQKRVPAASSGPPQHPEREGGEEGEGWLPFSSFLALYLHRVEGRREQEVMYLKASYIFNLSSKPVFLSVSVTAPFQDVQNIKSPQSKGCNLLSMGNIFRSWQAAAVIDNL